MDADGLIKLSKAEVLTPLLRSHEVLIPEEVYEEAVIRGKLELYEDAFELEKVLEKDRTPIRTVKPVRHISRVLEGVPSLGKGERAALHLYHAEDAGAILSDDRVFLRFLNESSIPYLTPAGVIVRLVEVGRLAHADGLAALDRLESHVRDSVYRRAREDLEEQRGEARNE